MILQKRISKPPKQFFTQNSSIAKHKKKKMKSKNNAFSCVEGERCSYQLIPPLLKYSYRSNIFALYGDVVLMKQNDVFSTEISLLNTYKKYQTIFTSYIEDQKVLNIIVDHIDVGSLPDWRSLETELKNNGDPVSIDLSKVVQTYSQTYEILRQKQNENQKEKTRKEKEKESRVKKTTKKRVKKLFKEHPCIWLKHRFRGEAFRIVEILFAESFLKLMGYCTDSFVSATLNEGLPPIEKNSTLDAKSLLISITEQFNFQQQKASKPVEFTSFLILKCGYIRKIKCQIHHMITFEGGIFGLESVIAVISAETPQIDTNGLLNYEIGEEFFSTAIIEDEKISQFF